MRPAGDFFFIQLSNTRVGTFVCFAVDIDLFAAALFSGGIGNRITSLFPEASAACLVRVAGSGTGNLNAASGAELVFVVYACCSAAVQNCHNRFLLIYDLQN